MSDRFTAKNVVVIGGNSGIGLAAARAFAQEGAKVVITGRDSHTLHNAEIEIGLGAVAIRSDISDMGQIAALFAQLGPQLDHIDVLFVNAGIGAFQPIEKVTEQDWDNIHDVNLKGVFFTVQQALPLLRAGSSIVLTGSIGALKGIPAGSVYAASKAGLRALGRCFAAELVGKGIRVNVVSPGPTDTPIIGRTGGLPPQAIPALRAQMIRNVPMHRMGTPEEVAAAVLFLASSESAFVTGVDFLVDGGAASF
ncbi:MAG TPA: SDR family oxidoreductase [Steroidobacteraceae bacterium]|jgi:NAD(P)-dependent dehydrogenase (short-subunit alcohol dehydrogenase family)